MTKKAISLTLQTENLLWLHAQSIRSGRSASDVLDAVIRQARGATALETTPAPSIAGSIRIDDRDPELLGADTALRRLFEGSLHRSRAPEQGRAAPRRKQRHG
jgi:hypothetical protein